MHYLETVIKGIDKTHPKLGIPVALAMVTVKARKMLLIVSPRGCGKSRVTSFIGEQHPNAMIQDAISTADLGAIKSELSDFKGVIIVDDISKAQTNYSMVTTCSTLAELCYSHYCYRHLRGMDFEIKGFNAGVLANIQPVLLREVIKHPLWEASMMDKSMRYYHLYRPLKPNPEKPNLKLEWGIDFDEVKLYKPGGVLAKELMRIGEVQWGLARVTEHILDLLRASAALDKRTSITQDDYKVLIKLLKPLEIESIVLEKEQLESQRYLHSNRLALLTEFATYRTFTLKQLSRDYKLSESRCYEIMRKLGHDWVIVDKNPTSYAPSDEFYKVLKGVGLK